MGTARLRTGVDSSRGRHSQTHARLDVRNTTLRLRNDVVCNSNQLAGLSRKTAGNYFDDVSLLMLRKFDRCQLLKEENVPCVNIKELG